MPVGAHGDAMFRLCPKLAFWALPENVIDARFSTPIAFDALPTTVAAFCAAATAATQVMKTTMSAAAATRVPVMGDLL
jgi:hypothetical protein